MKSTLQKLVLVTITAVSLTGCLTVERKSYKITMTGKESGKCTITFQNIVSSKDEGKDISFKDFAELVTDYLQGTKLEDEMAGVHHVQKNLISVGGVLNGEMSFEFDSLSALRMYRYNETAPLMMYLGTMNSETYETSNGTYGGEKMPVIFWPSNHNHITLSTKVTEIDTSHISLAKQYASWSASNKK